MNFLNVYKNQEDYERAVIGGAAVKVYVTTISDFSYVQHGPLPFKYVNGFGKHEINPMDIDRVTITANNVTVILNLDSQSALPWEDFIG